MKLRLMLLAAACLAGPAGAAWHQISSPHFVIYADEDPAKLKAYAEKLERFDKAVRLARGMKDPALSPGNRLPIYIVADTVAVSKLHPGKKSVAGFYRPGAITGVAVVPKSVPKTMLTTADQVFLHEYAHHLTMQDFRAPLPAWLVEGFAEFYATADVNADGSVGIGGGAVNRSRTLRQPRNPLPYTQMLKGVRPAVPTRAAIVSGSRYSWRPVNGSCQRRFGRKVSSGRSPIRNRSSSSSRSIAAIVPASAPADVP